MNTKSIRDDIEWGRGTRPSWVAKQVSDAALLAMDAGLAGRLGVKVTMRNAIRVGKFWISKHEKAQEKMMFAALRWSVVK